LLISVCSDSLSKTIVILFYVYFLPNCFLATKFLFKFVKKYLRLYLSLLSLVILIISSDFSISSQIHRLLTCAMSNLKFRQHFTNVRITNYPPLHFQHMPYLSNHTSVILFIPSAQQMQCAPPIKISCRSLLCAPLQAVALLHLPLWPFRTGFLHFFVYFHIWLPVELISSMGSQMDCTEKPT